MDANEVPFLHGALTLLEECRDTVETLFERFDAAEDRKAKRRIVETALHELKVSAAIEELMVHPALDPALVEAQKEARRHVARLIAELEAMTGDEKRHDAKFALLFANVRRLARNDGSGPPPRDAARLRGRLGAEAAERPRGPDPTYRYMKIRSGAIMKLSLFLALGATALAAAAQSNQGGGQQLNPNTSLNSIVNGGATGVAPPVNTVVVPVTPASAKNAPATLEKDRPLKRPLPVAKPPAARKKLSDRALARRVREAIARDLTLARGPQDVRVEASDGRVTLTGTVLTGDDKYKIAAKAAELAGKENVADLLVVKAAAP